MIGNRLGGVADVRQRRRDCLDVFTASTGQGDVSLMLLTRRVKSERVYAEIDWSLLLMFAGLFIIVAGAQRALLTPDLIAMGPCTPPPA